MIVLDLLPGQVAAELLNMLVQVSKKSVICRSTSQQLIDTLRELSSVFEEIRYSGVELPAGRQLQLNRVSDDLRVGVDLCHKIVGSSRWNAYKNLQYARKLEKINKTVTRFIQGPMQLHMLANQLHRLSFSMDGRFDRLQGSADSVEGILESRLQGMRNGESV